MRIKIILFSENIGIPKLPIGIGLGLINVWIDGNGYTSATNDVGDVGYVVLETPDVELGELDPARAQAFSNLHGKLVHYQMQISRFLRNGGTAHISMAVLGNNAGNVAQQSIEFYAESCSGVAVTAGAVDITTEMLQQPRTIAAGEMLLGDDAVATLVQSADIVSG